VLSKDKEETLKRSFADKRSYVRNDKSEVLYGPDWLARKFDLWQRSNGCCEYFVRCTALAEDAHHVIRRSKGRDDRLSNLQALCRYHHRLIDRRQTQWTKSVKQIES